MRKSIQRISSNKNTSKVTIQSVKASVKKSSKESRKVSTKNSKAKQIYYLAADHAGFTLKERIKNHLDKKKIPYIDCAPTYKAGDDYTDYAGIVAQNVAANPLKKRGILVCGTGFGMAIVANKVPGIRAVTPYNVRAARLSKLHNDANILALGGRDGPSDNDNIKILDAWLQNSFDKEKRHIRRNRKIKALEKQMAEAQQTHVPDKLGKDS